MPYTFSLPTTSALLYLPFVQCISHPSLIQAATVQRSVLRNVLKSHKRLPRSSQDSNLTSVLVAIKEYVPYLLALDAGLANKQVSDEEIDVVLLKDVEVEWRPCLATTGPGREAARVKGKGLDFEIAFVLTTLAYTYTLLARVQLHTLFASVPPSPEQRLAAITTAAEHLLQTRSLHEYLIPRMLDAQVPSAAIDVASQTQSGLGSLALSEATLLYVLKDDLYPAVVAQDRNNSDRDWMIKAPDIPKVRAHLYARLCLGAAEHAAKANALLSSPGSARGNQVDESIIKYSQDLQRTSRAKACRFFGIDAELSGKTGEAIAWLIAGKKELGFKVNEGDGARIKGLAKLKKDWTQRKEDRKVEKGVEWGSDAGRLEEARVIEWLEKKWVKENDLISSQPVPPSGSLLSNMPLGRNIHISQSYTPPNLDAETLAKMRAPPDTKDGTADPGDDSDDSGEEPKRAPVPGAFPGASTDSEPAYF